MPFWEHEGEEERRGRDSGRFLRRARRESFNIVARNALQQRGIDPDIVPSLGSDIGADRNVLRGLVPSRTRDETRMTKREVGARAQSLGVSIADYRAAAPASLQDAASAVGEEHRQLAELREKGYSTEQALAARRISRHYYGLIDQGMSEADAEARTEADLSNDYMLLKVPSSADPAWQEEFQRRTQENLDIRMSSIERRNQRKAALGYEPDLTPEGEAQAAREHALSVMESKERSTPLTLAAGAGHAVDYPRRVVKKEVLEPLIPDFEFEVPREVMWGLGMPTSEGVTVKSDFVEEAASWIFDPLNVLPVIGFGPDIMRVAKRGGGALRAYFRKNPEALQFVSKEMAKSPKPAALTPDELGGFSRRPRRKPPAGGPPEPSLAEAEQHVRAASNTLDEATNYSRYVRNEVKAGRLGPEMASEANASLAAARKGASAARKQLNSTRISDTRQAVVESVRSAGGDDVTADIIGRSFDDSVAMRPNEDALLTASSRRQWLAHLGEVATGIPSGAVGWLAGRRFVLLGALRRYSSEVAEPVFRDVQRLLDKELPSIVYTGPKRWVAQAAGIYKPHHVVQHPEWFSGMSKELRGKMDEAQGLMRSRLEAAKAQGYPIEAIERSYLEQLWEIPETPLTTSASYLPGRVSVAKERLFDDYFKGIAQGFTPKDMTVEELMRHSSGLLDQAISDAWMRQEVLRRFGTEAPGKVAHGRVAFQHPLYKGWYGPKDVSNWLTAMDAPVGPTLRKVENVAAATKGTVFGPADLAVSGVQFPLSVAHGGLQLAAGTLNRALEALHLPFFHVWMQDPAVASRFTQAALDTVHIGWGPSSVRAGGGTLLKYIPVVGKHIDKPVSRYIDFMARMQFGHALTAIRVRMHEGNLIALKMTGNDITDPAVRKLSGEWANAGSGASLGAAGKGRQALEATAFTSAQMTRANLAVYGQLLKNLNPKAGKMERLRAALVLANLGAYTYGIQYLFNSVFGDGPQEWVPGRSEWATVRVGGRTVPIIPQRSILRGIDKSIKAIARGEPADIALAWSQVAVGKGSPLAGAPLAAAGIGFEPGTGRFQLGGLSDLGRSWGMVPAPPIVEQGLFQDDDELSLAIAGLGFNPYDTSSGKLLREQFANTQDTDLNFESPYHRQIIEGNSRLRKLWEKSREESREYGSEAAIESHEIREEIAAAEDDQGIVRLAEAALGGDALAVLNWPDARANFLTWRAGTWHKKLTGFEPRTEIGRLVAQYYELNPKDAKFTDPSGVTDWSAFKAAQDAVLTQMPAGDAAAIRSAEKFENPAAERLDKQYRGALDQLRPYWDLRDEVWDRLRDAYPELRRYSTFNDLQDSKVQELLRAGVPEGDIQWQLGRVPVISNVEQLIGRARHQYRMEHPTVDALLVRWYGNTPIREQVGTRGSTTRGRFGSRRTRSRR